MAARWARKRDLIEPDVVAALRKIGASVIVSDHPDLIIGYRGKTFLVEVKSKGGRLTASQKKLFGDWQGGPLALVWSVSDALELVTGRT